MNDKPIDAYGPDAPDYVVGPPCDGPCCVPPEPDNVFAAADEQHPPPDWMADAIGREQAREEMELAREARAEQQLEAKRLVTMYKDMVESSLRVVDGPHSNAWCATQALNGLATNTRCLLAALDRLEEVEGL